MTFKSTQQFFFDLGIVQSFSHAKTPTDTITRGTRLLYPALVTAPGALDDLGRDLIGDRIPERPGLGSNQPHTHVRQVRRRVRQDLAEVRLVKHGHCSSSPSAREATQTIKKR